MEEKTNQWISNNPSLFGKGVAVVVLLFGICLMVGAIKNWDWLYKADGHYQNNWSMGQISRYLGRDTARIIGFCGGILFTAIGGFLVYAGFFK
ncbi:Imm17 family immunity protein [Pedobacter agri]|uniref:Imm17 family immunity protein n=1 Tax=Pedobacter agri TaxID=454586 RepID=UPI00292EC12E|nr:Imm17 family immunity protein [Pedobacter agri]